MCIDVLNILGLEHLNHSSSLLRRSSDVVLSKDVYQLRSEGFGRSGEEILAIEPPTLHIVKLSTCFGALTEVELLNQFVHRKDFLIITRIPTEEGKEVDHGLWEITAFAIATAHCAIGSMPLKGEDWEAQFVAITLRELTIAGGLQEEGKVSKAGHGVFPSKGAIK